MSAETDLLAEQAHKSAFTEAATCKHLVELGQAIVDTGPEHQDELLALAFQVGEVHKTLCAEVDEIKAFTTRLAALGPVLHKATAVKPVAKHKAEAKPAK